MNNKGAGQIEKLLILLITASKQAEEVAATSPEYRQYTKQVLNAWKSMTVSTIKEMKRNIGDPNASEILESWAVYFKDALGQFIKAKDKTTLMRVLEEFNNGIVEFTDTDLKTTCVNFGRICQKSPKQNPAWLFHKYQKDMEKKRIGKEAQKKERDEKRGRPKKYSKVRKIDSKIQVPEPPKGICKNCDNLRSEVRHDDIQPWCTQGKMKFKAAVRIDWDAPQFQSGCEKFKEIPQNR